MKLQNKNSFDTKVRLFIGDLKHDVMYQIILRMIKILRVTEFRE